MIDAHQRFEIRAEVFRLETGLLAPGKDSRDGAFSEEERAEAWSVFCAEHKKSFDLFFYAADRVLFQP